MIATALNLNFACGGSNWKGFENSDINGHPGVVPVDLQQFPYPYKDGSAAIIMLSHGLFGTRNGVPYHPDLAPIMEEFSRILQPSGWLRIDENPCRCYPEEGLIPSEVDEEAGRGYPEHLRIPRQQFVDVIYAAGFSDVFEVNPSETLIPCDGPIREAVLGNKMSHYSFTIEAQK